MKADIQKKALVRLNRIGGQVEGLKKMVRDERYCVDIIAQSFAIKEALTGVERLLLENHLATHVMHQMKSGKEKKAIEEILKVYSLKRT
jgi:DNA-binding FrmR family transcriptional regulator